MEFRTYLEKIRKSNGEKYLPKSIDNYEMFVNKHFHLFEGKSIDETLEVMNTIIVKYNHANLRASFRLFLMFLGVDEDSPKLKLLKSTKKRASAISSLRVLTDKVIVLKDFKLLMNSVEPEWQLMIGFLYDTGCRENEMLTTCWKDINFLDESKDTIFAEINILGKGSKRRVVYLSESVTNMLKEKMVDVKPEDRIFVFRKPDGSLYKRQEKELLVGFKKRTKEILGKEYVIHAIRHTKLSHLADNGADVLGISSYAGHNNLATTQIYVKMSKKIGENTYRKFSEDLAN